MLKTIQWYLDDLGTKAASKVDWSAGLSVPLMAKVFDTVFEGDFPHRGKAIYHEHQAMLRKLVPKERLLEYHVKEGWGPLCEFLGQPVPVDDFPRCNDADTFVTRSRLRNLKQIGNGLFRYLVFAIGAWIILSVGMFLRAK